MVWLAATLRLPSLPAQPWLTGGEGEDQALQRACVALRQLHRNLRGRPSSEDSGLPSETIDHAAKHDPSPAQALSPKRDGEAQFAFEQAGALAERIHINRLREQPALLQRSQVLVIPGGFTYGDDVAAGKILANQLAHFLGDALRQFRDADKLIL